MANAAFMGLSEAHPDQKFIESLVNNDPKGVAEIYKVFVPKVVAFIQKNSGDEAAARDIVQEVLVIIYDQAKTKGLTLTCPFDAYFFLLCKRKWFNVLKKKRPEGVTINEEITSMDAQAIEQVGQTEVEEQKFSLFQKTLDSMGKACRELLKLSFTIKSMEEVAQKLGVSYGYARKKKSLCIGKLTEMIQGSPQFQQLKNG